MGRERGHNGPAQPGGKGSPRRSPPPPPAPAGTARPGGPRARGPARPAARCALGSEAPRPRSARLRGAPPAAGLSFPACSAAARRQGAAPLLPASAGRLRAGAGFGRPARGGGQRHSGRLTPGPAAAQRPPPAGAGRGRAGAAAAGGRRQRLRRCGGSYGGTRGGPGGSVSMATRVNSADGADHGGAPRSAGRVRAGLGREEGGIDGRAVRGQPGRALPFPQRCGPSPAPPHRRAGGVAGAATVTRPGRPSRVGAAGRGSPHRPAWKA